MLRSRREGGTDFRSLVCPFRLLARFCFDEVGEDAVGDALGDGITVGDCGELCGFFLV